LFERQSRNRFPRRRPVGVSLCRSNPTFPHASFYDRLWFSPRRDNFGDGAAAIGDDDRLARRGEADIFAELVLQDLQPYLAHRPQVASGSYFVKKRWKLRYHFEME